LALSCLLVFFLSFSSPYTTKEAEAGYSVFFFSPSVYKGFSFVSSILPDGQVRQRLSFLDKTAHMLSQ
jgi:hypothetical protein